MPRTSLFSTFSTASATPIGSDLRRCGSLLRALGGARLRSRERVSGKLPRPRACARRRWSHPLAYNAARENRLKRSRQLIEEESGPAAYGFAAAVEVEKLGPTLAQMMGTFQQILGPVLQILGAPANILQRPAVAAATSVAGFFSPGRRP